MIREITPNVEVAIGYLFVALAFASAIVYGLTRLNPEKDYRELVLRTRSWWVILALVCGALLLTNGYTISFFGFLSFLALKEYLSLVPTRRADRRVLFWAYLSIPIHYYWIYDAWYGMFVIFIPVYVFLFIPMRAVMIGETEMFLRGMSTIHWGLMVTVFGLSHLAYLLMLDEGVNLAGAGPGLVIYVLVLTQLNDVFQYCWGKALGKRKIIPKVSPNKTWEGFLGGVATTTVLAVLIAPYLTPLQQEHAIWAGVIVSVGGFFGDVMISAIKRDFHVKDSGYLLPGHGGILDRMDSLCFTAPIFFHYLRYFYY